MDLSIPRLGEPRIASPFRKTARAGEWTGRFIPEGARLLLDLELPVPPSSDAAASPAALELAGPRESIFFDPSKLRVGIVTCGGLCPGINNVIRSLVLQLHHRYGVRRIVGFQYGFAGLAPSRRQPVVDLDPAVVREIHHDGGSLLGTSRGPQAPEVMVDTLERMGVGLLLAIGGDGTLRGLDAIHAEIARRGLKIAVVAVPKTIDNDIPLVDRSFGFDTAFSIAVQSIRAAHTEAQAHQNGIGLVRLMGRHTGYIAATATVAEPDVNCVLVPEVAFALDGDHGLLAWLRRRLESRGHAVIVVAEGAGQDLVGGEGADPSGNRRFGDVGALLKECIRTDLGACGIEHTLKYIDPSYQIRSVPANPNDALFCSFLARHAVHAGISGRTCVLVAMRHDRYVHLPIREAVLGRKTLDPAGDLWQAVLESTGQPPTWGNAQ